MSATIIVDLGFGDAGKGSIIDFLARRTGRPSVVVRFNGGAQAAHNVVTPTGVHHTFAQFGSGTFMSGSRTFLSRFMMVDPLTMENEAEHLTYIGCGNPFHALYVDEECMVTTLYHKLVNRERERERGGERHGSCGMGIGETMSLHLIDPESTIRISDLHDSTRVLPKLGRQREWAHSLYPEISRRLSPRDDVVMADRMGSTAGRFNTVTGDYLGQVAANYDLLFEGAQGVLLDETYGFHPYTTWSTTTFQNAQTLLGEIGYSQPVERLGVLRAYGVRHGPGPFPTEDTDLTALLPERHNSHGEWQGAFRVGSFDAVLARYAIEVCGGVDSVAITNIDRLSRLRDRVAICTAYQHCEARIDRLIPVNQPTLLAQAGLGRFVSQCTPVLTERDEGLKFVDYLDIIQEQLGARVQVHSYGPTAIDKMIVTDDP